MQQKLMNVRVRCMAADSIYANKTKSSARNTEYPHPSYAREGRLRMNPRERYSVVSCQKKVLPGLRTASAPRSSITHSQG